MAMFFNHLFVKSSHACDAAVVSINISYILTSSSNANSFSLQTVMVSEVMGEPVKLDKKKKLAGSDGLDPAF